MKNNVTVADYISLITDFINKKITVEQYEKQWWDMTSCEMNYQDYDRDDIYEILFSCEQEDSLFAHIEDYVPSDLYDPQNDLDVNEDSLRRISKIALNKLLKIQNGLQPKK